MRDGSMKIPNNSTRWQAFLMDGGRAKTYPNRLMIVAKLTFTLVLLAASVLMGSDQQYVLNQ